VSGVVLAPRTGAGVELSDVRRTRIVLDQGVLAVTTPAGTRTIDSADVTRAVVVPSPGRSQLSRPTAGESLALISGAGVELVLDIRDFCVNPAAEADLARRVSRVDLLVRQLRVPLEAATGSDVAAIKASPTARVTVPTPASVSPRTSFTVLVLAMVVAFISWPLTFVGDTPLALGGLVVGVLALALASKPLFALVRGRRLFFAVADTQPDVLGAVVFAPSTSFAGLTVGLAAARLYIAPDWVVLHDRGTEVWVAGATNGGVTTAVLGNDLIRMSDDDGGEQLLLERLLWAPDHAYTEALAAALEGAGIHVSLVDGPIQEGRAGVELAGAARTGVIGARVPWPYQNGSPSYVSGWFAWLLSAMVFVGPLGLLLTYGRWWTIPFTFAAGAVLATLTWYSLRLSAWDRRQRQRVKATALPATKASGGHSVRG